MNNPTVVLVFKTALLFFKFMIFPLPRAKYLFRSKYVKLQKDGLKQFNMLF